MWIRNTAFFLENLRICDWRTGTPRMFVDLRICRRTKKCSCPPLLYNNVKQWHQFIIIGCESSEIFNVKKTFINGKQTCMFARVLALICTDQIAKGSLCNCITDNWIVQQKSRNRSAGSTVRVKYNRTCECDAICDHQKIKDSHVLGGQNPAADHGGKDEYRHCGEVQTDRDPGRGNCQVGDHSYFFRV